MDYGKHLLEELRDPEFVKLLSQESLMMDIQEKICRVMEEKGISCQELAMRMGKSESFVTQMLNSGRNLTLRTVADVATAMKVKMAWRTI